MKDIVIFCRRKNCIYNKFDGHTYGSYMCERKDSISIGEDGECAMFIGKIAGCHCSTCESNNYCPNCGKFLQFKTERI